MGFFVEKTHNSSQIFYRVKILNLLIPITIALIVLFTVPITYRMYILILLAILAISLSLDKNYKEIWGITLTKKYSMNGFLKYRVNIKDFPKISLD